MLSICLCARFQANPKESHLTNIKRIIKYLKGTTNIDNENQLADIFTKPVARDRFFFIRNELGILDGSSIE